MIDSKTGVLKGYIDSWLSEFKNYKNNKAGNEIPLYEDYVKSISDGADILKKSDSKKVVLINSLTKSYNQILLSGKANREIFLKFYLAIELLVRNKKKHELNI